MAAAAAVERVTIMRLRASARLFNVRDALYRLIRTFCIIPQ